MELLFFLIRKVVAHNIYEDRVIWLDFYTCQSGPWHLTVKKTYLSYSILFIDYRLHINIYKTLYLRNKDVSSEFSGCRRRYTQVTKQRHLSSSPSPVGDD